jgi:hypothetical protein
MRLTERDREILRLVHRHRFLDSAQIIALLEQGEQQVLRRLQLLFHHGYLVRPRAQIDYYHRGGSRRMAYGLGNEGARLLKSESGSPLDPHWSTKNRSVGRLFLAHALLVSQIMVGVEVGCRRQAGVRLLQGDELPRLASGSHSGREGGPWQVSLNRRLKLRIIPDRVFALEFEAASHPRNRVLICIEADQGTMPVVRHGLSQTSMYRKFLAYEAAWKAGLQRTQFGLHRLRVLVITTSPERVQSLHDACASLKTGPGLFLFADVEAMRRHGDLLTLPCQGGRPGHTTTLLD